MVEGSVTRCTETMSERESMEAFVDGAKKAAYAARELAKELDSADWVAAADMLEAIRDSGVQLSRMRSMSRFETLMAASMKTGSKLIM